MKTRPGVMGIKNIFCPHWQQIRRLRDHVPCLFGNNQIIEVEDPKANSNTDLNLTISSWYAIDLISIKHDIDMVSVIERCDKCERRSRWQDIRSTDDRINQDIQKTTQPSSQSSSNSTIFERADSNKTEKTQPGSSSNDWTLMKSTVRDGKEEKSTNNTFLTPREFFYQQSKKLEQKLLEVDNLRRNLLHKHKIWEQFKVSPHHGTKEAAQDVKVNIKEQKDYGRLIYNLTNSPNVNCFGVLNLSQMVPAARNQWVDLDLHNLKVEEAMGIFKQRLDQLKIFGDLIRETFFWFVITGTSERASVGATTLRTEVLRYLYEYQKAHQKRKFRLEFAEALGNDGRIDIVFAY